MNKKIWLTGALSIIAIFTTVFIYNNFIMEKPEVPVDVPAPAPIAAVQAAEPSYRSLTGNSYRDLEYSNGLLSVRFTSEGGQPLSLKLEKFSGPDGLPVEMIYSAGSGILPFSLHFGGFEAADSAGRYKGGLTEDGVIYSTDFEAPDGRLFRVSKKYGFKPGSYMLRFDLSIEALDGRPLPAEDGFLYSIGFGPQIGPVFEKLNRGYVYRYFSLIDGGEKKNLAVPPETGVLSLDGSYDWLGIEGRYFTAITVPPSGVYKPAWDERAVDGLVKRNSYYLQRPEEASSSVHDSCFLYFGPKDPDILADFDSPSTNQWGLGGLNLEAASGRAGIINSLSGAVKAVLSLLHKVVPNYGIDIILFALLIQALIFPLSKRTYENSIRMQMLGPDIALLKKKYKYNDAKMNQETVKLFEQNGVKARSSMLPFIIHLPFFILLYVSLLTDIDFRMAAFIPGWIPDVAVPEYILDFSPAVMPVTGWDKIRLLPVLALAVALIQSRYIQAPEDSLRSMRVMSYLVPIIMFLVIYNMPSGAVLYWLTMTATNLLLQWRIKVGYVSN